MSLFRLPCGKLSLAFLAVPAGKDSRVERPCQTFDGFIGVRGSVCGLFLFVQTHAPLIVPPWQSWARKSKFQFHIRRKGAEVFHPALAAGGSLMAYKCLSLCRFRGFTAGFCKNFVQRFQKFKMRFQGKAKNFDLFRMRKKFRVQVERNFPTLSHERFSIVEPVVQFEKLLGNIIAFINAGYSYHTCGLPADRPLQTKNRRTQVYRGCTILAASACCAHPEVASR